MDWHPRYVALLQSPRPTLDLKDIAAAIAAHRPELAICFQAEGLVLFAPPGLAVTVIEPDRFVVVGPVFSPDYGRLVHAASRGPADLADLVTRFWGRYIAFRRSEGAQGWEVLRDPSGSICALLVDGPIGIVSDELPHWLLAPAGARVRPDRHRLANALAIPTITAHCSLLTNVEILPAGAVACWRGSWSAARLVWPALREPPQADAEPGAIRVALETVARAIAGERRTMVLELSGGLDSAITLGAMRSADPAAPIVAVNIATPEPRGDERATARDAAARWSVELVEVAPREEDLDYRVALEGAQPALRNGYGLDSVVERAVAGVCQAFEADMILTGQGGDAAFFQFPSDRVALDRYLDEGPASLWSSQVLDVARRARMSVWRLQWRMITQGRSRGAIDRVPPTPIFLTSVARAALDPSFGDHPWVVAARDLPPGKRFQMFALANCEWYNGPVARRQHADLVHPLLSQPVLEACLRMPTYRLSYGTQDRALARDLFADHLPPSIARRRLKGETSTYYRRSIVHNLAYLRHHLLDGCLVAAGLLDPEALDAALDEDALIWRHDARGVVALASIESWARHWGL